MADISEAPELRVIVVGKTGSGKSATANTILGEKKFKSDAGFSSITRHCKEGTGFFRGREISVMDTPGYFDPDRDNKVTSRIIKDSVPDLGPGFHAILLVLKLDRFTPEEKKVIDEVENILNLRAKDYVILVFTRKEELKGRSLDSKLGSAPADLQKVVDFCGHRYVAFNNNATGEEREAQVAELMQLIDRMTKLNANKPLYTPEMFKQDSLWLDFCTVL